MTLTKADLISKIHMSHNLSKTRAGEIVETFLAISKNCLAGGDDLLLSGFGKFRVKGKKARRGRNPKTGEEMVLEARRVVTFHPSGHLRDRIKG
ncbi:MAG: integration host factor subunit alpha [Thermodesulfobacteriota bacterium]|jgi:integration host factor subunit alpha